MRYVCNPVTVDAFGITNVSNVKSEQDGFVIEIDTGEVVELEPEKTSRMEPKIGDYLVRTHTPNEYEYLNPKEIFEAKYTEFGDTHPTDMVLGEFTLRGAWHLGSGDSESIYISRNSGEGGSFNREQLEEVVRKFFEERF